MKVKDKIYKRLITNLTAFCGILILCSTNTAYAAPAPQYDVTDAGETADLATPEEYQVDGENLTTWIKKANGTTAVSTPAATAAVVYAVLARFLNIDKSYNKANNGAVNSTFN